MILDADFFMMKRAGHSCSLCTENSPTVMKVEQKQMPTINTNHSICFLEKEKSQ